MLWAGVAGLVFQLLNALMRGLTFELPAMQVQFLRYLFGFVVMLPVIVRHGISNYRPRNLRGLLWRGVIHTAGLMLFFVSLPHLSLAYITAIAFATPIFIMLGAAWVFGEKLYGARWAASLVGLSGVMIVVAPKLTAGDPFYSLLMLLSAPVFAASFLITKSLTRTDSPSSIVVWQSLTIAVFSLPLALPAWTWPTASQWSLFFTAGVIGSFGHWCLTRSFAVVDISATQPIKFLDLVWAVLLGLVIWGEQPALATLAGAAVILLATIWLARYESRRRL